MIPAEPAHANAFGGDGDPGKPAQEAAKPVVMVAQDVLAADADAQGRVFTAQVGLRRTGDLDGLQVGGAGVLVWWISGLRDERVSQDGNAERRGSGQGERWRGHGLVSHASIPSVAGAFLPGRLYRAQPMGSSG